MPPSIITFILSRGDGVPCFHSEQELDKEQPLLRKHMPCVDTYLPLMGPFLSKKVSLCLPQ